MNILILSAGTRNKIVAYYKEALQGRGKVVATDCSPLAPALYEADAFRIVPRITDPDYLDRILEVVREFQIRGCFSLIDPELSLLAENREAFEELGCIPMVSPYPLTEACLHKAQMAEIFRRNSLLTPDFYTSTERFEEALQAGRIQFPVFVKPENGSASLHINKAADRQEVEVLAGRTPGLMIQKFMDGEEYGADVYIDMCSGKCVSIFLKKKLKMRAGETDKAVSVLEPELFETIRQFVEREGFRGQIDIDIFKVDGEWYFSEVNPRYGGGYPHAYECGVDMPSLFLRNLNGQENPVSIGKYEAGICMMKYNELLVTKVEGYE